MNKNEIDSAMTWRIAVLCALFLASAAGLYLTDRPEIRPAREPLDRLPMRLGTWEGHREADFDNKTTSILGVDDYVNRVYFNPEGAAIGLYIGYYYSQREGNTIHSPLNCLPGAGWNPVNHRLLAIPACPGGASKINSIIIAKGPDRQVVLYWYQSHSRVIASEYLGKIHTVLDALRMNRTDAALVRLASPVVGQEDEIIVEKRTVEFATALFPELYRFLPN